MPYNIAYYRCFPLTRWEGHLFCQMYDNTMLLEWRGIPFRLAYSSGKVMANRLSYRRHRRTDGNVAMKRNEIDACHAKTLMGGQPPVNSLEPRFPIYVTRQCKSLPWESHEEHRNSRRFPVILSRSLWQSRANFRIHGSSTSNSHV